MFFNTPKMFEDLSSQRLLLRAPRYKDAEDIYEFCGDAQSCRYVDWSPHQSVAESRDFIMYLKSRAFKGDSKSYTWFVQLKDEQKVIATISLVDSDYYGKIATVGYTFSKKYHHQGFATEALITLIEYLFNVRNFERIEAKVLPENQPSIALLERVGMKKEGMLRKGVFCKTCLRDVYIYSILKEEFLNIKAPFKIYL
jgi:ribosomal-protein-alanine N-acetyltransferase